MKEELRIRIYNKYDGRCAYCGKKIEYKDMQVDHIVPFKRKRRPIPSEPIDDPAIKKHNERLLSEYKKHKKLIKKLDIEENMMPSCRRCNLYKGTMDLESFRQEISKQVERLRKRNWNFRIAEDYGLVQEIKIKVTFYFEKRVVEVDGLAEEHKKRR